MSPSPETARRHDRPMLGIALMLGFCVSAPLGDAIAKLLSDLPVLLLVWIRFAGQVLLMLPFALRARGRIWPQGRLRRLVALRAVMHICGILCMFTALRFLPLAEAVAIAFVMPFVLLLFGRLFLGEEVGPRRLIACAVGFAGTLMVIQPSFMQVGLAALLPLGVALFFALFMLITRAVAHEIEPFALQVSGGVMATVFLLPLLGIGWATGLPGLGLRLPEGGEWGLLVGLCVISSGAHLLMGWSLRFASTTTVGPMQYLEIPFSTLIGWLVFRHLPNGLAALGIAVTVAAGLYVIWREQKAARRRAAAA